MLPIPSCANRESYRGLGAFTSGHFLQDGLLSNARILPPTYVLSVRTVDLLFDLSARPSVVLLDSFGCKCSLGHMVAAMQLQAAATAIPSHGRYCSGFIADLTAEYSRNMAPPLYAE
jgi:hypothetical protein